MPGPSDVSCGIPLSWKRSGRLVQPMRLVAVLAPIIVDDIPQTAGVASASAPEQDRVTRRGEAASSKTSGKGVRRFRAVVQGTGGAAGAAARAGSRGDVEDAMRQVI